MCSILVECVTKMIHHKQAYEQHIQDLPFKSKQGIARKLLGAKQDALLKMIAIPQEHSGIGPWSHLVQISCGRLSTGERVLLRSLLVHIARTPATHNAGLAASQRRPCGLTLRAFQANTMRQQSPMLRLLIFKASLQLPAAI